MTYPRPLRIIHWSVALLVCGQLALAVVLTQLRSLEYGQWLLALHRQLGLVILLLVAARFVVWGRHRSPTQAESLPRWQRSAAVAVHRMFFVLLVAQPLVGILIAWGRGDSVSVFGVVPLPAPWEMSDATRERLMTVHGGLAALLFALCFVHIGAVIFNRVVRRVSVIERMLPATEPGLLVNRQSVAAQLSLAFGIVLAIALLMGINAAWTYRAFSASTSALQQGELAAAEQTRIAQVAWKEVLGLTEASHARDTARLSELLDATKTALDEAASRSEAGDTRTQLEALATQLAAFSDHTLLTADAAREVDAHLQEIVDTQGLTTFQHRTETEQQGARGHDLIIVSILPMVLASVIAALLLARSVTGSLRRMSELIRSIESQRQAQTIAVTGQGEFACLTRDIVSMRLAVEERSNAEAAKRAQLEAERVQLAEAQRIKDTETDQHLRRERQLHRERLAADFEQQVSGIVEKVLSTAKELTATAGSMSESATDAAERSRDASSEAERTSGTASSIAESTKNLSMGARTVRENAQKSQSRAALAVEEAAAAKKQIDHLVAAARQIVSITDLIAGIARQTNLLAINARIEAARAGDVGLGFSVVANEVKNLANQTSKATGGIAKQIEEVTAAAARSSESLQRLRDVVGGVEVDSAAIFASIDEQSAATRDIAGRVSEVSASTHSVAQDVRGAEATASATAELSEEVTRAAAIVDDQAVRLSAQVTLFLGQLRATGTTALVDARVSAEQDQGIPRALEPDTILRKTEMVA